MGITNTAESKLLTAKTIMNKFVVVRSRLFLQIEIQTKVVPIRDKIFKVMSKLTSTTIKLRPRDFKSSGIIDTKTPTLASNWSHCSRVCYKASAKILASFQKSAWYINPSILLSPVELSIAHPILIFTYSLGYIVKLRYTNSCHFFVYVILNSDLRHCHKHLFCCQTGQVMFYSFSFFSCSRIYFVTIWATSYLKTADKKAFHLDTLSYLSYSEHDQAKRHM